MCESTTPDREQVAQTFDALQASIRAERRRTAAERRAFETFADRVDEVDISDSSPRQSLDSGMREGHGATLVSSGHAGWDGDTPTEAIRCAYEETVMAVSFYDEEYGDDYAESLRAEFGPEVATALIDPDCFGPSVKAALTAAIKRAAREREHLIETCERERESVDAAANTLLPVVAELDSIVSPDPENEPFGTLEARWNRLSRLRERCESAAANRQSSIDDRRSHHDLPIDAPDVCAYLYQAHDSAYPILSICTGLSQRVTTVQTAYERAMAHY
jgi:hypothetical protein